MKSILIAALIAVAALVHGGTFAVEFDGDLWNLETNTLIADTGLSSVNSAAYGLGRLFVATDRFLYTVNTVTGAPTLLSELNLPIGAQVRGMAFSGGVLLYMIVNEGASDNLYFIANFTNPIAFLVGPLGSSGNQALEFDDSGTLYAWNVSTAGSGGLRTIDVNTGAATDVNPAVGGSGEIQTLFESGSRLFGARDEVFIIDKSTGTSLVTDSPAFTDARGVSASTSIHTPRSMAFILGRRESGGIQDTMWADGNVLRMCKFIVPNQFAPPVELELRYIVGLASYDRLEARSLSRMVHSGAFSLRISLLEVSLQSYTRSSTAPVSTSPAIHRLIVTTPSDIAKFVDTDGLVKVRMAIQRTGPAAVSAWCHELDQISLRLDN